MQILLKMLYEATLCGNKKEPENTWVSLPKHWTGIFNEFDEVVCFVVELQSFETKADKFW